MTDATTCRVCGGPFSAKRIIIEGDAYHQRCALMSYGPHTPQDMNRMGEEMQRLRDSLRSIANGEYDYLKDAMNAARGALNDPVGQAGGQGERS